MAVDTYREFAVNPLGSFTAERQTDSTVARTVLRLLVLGTGIAIVLAQATAAPAGGSWFDPVKNRYEPGEQVTLVGYTGGGNYGWVEDGPFIGFLLETGDDIARLPDGRRLELGELVLTETGRGGYLSLRASITFDLPARIKPGLYMFDYCNVDCDQRLGDLIGGWVHVGVDPRVPDSREWPLDDPEVVNLQPDDVLKGPGFEVTAGDVQSGAVHTDEASGLPKTQPVANPPAPTHSRLHPVASDTSEGTGTEVDDQDAALVLPVTGSGPNSTDERRSTVLIPALMTALTLVVGVTALSRHVTGQKLAPRSSLQS